MRRSLQNDVILDEFSMEMVAMYARHERLMLSLLTMQAVVELVCLQMGMVGAIFRFVFDASGWRILLTLRSTY